MSRTRSSGGIGGRGMGNGGNGRPVAFGLIALALASVVVLGGCSHSRRIESGSAPRTTPTTSAIETTTSVVSATARDEAVVAAYRAHWAAWYSAVQVADPTSPGISAT